MTDTGRVVELVSLVSQGDRNAGDRLFREVLLGLIESETRRNRGGAPVQEQEDIAQSAALSLSQELVNVCRAFDPQVGSPHRFLRVVVRRNVFRALRGSKAKKWEPMRPGPGGDETEALAANAEDALERAEAKELTAAIEDFLADQAPEHRALFEMHRFEDATAREIAEVTGLSLSAVQQRISRLTRALLAHLKDRGILLGAAVSLLWLLLGSGAPGQAGSLTPDLLAHTSFGDP